MKKYYFFIVTLCLITFSSVNAKIWIVANNGLPADFTTMQDAHDGVSAGDTIHVLGSKLRYDNLTCSKQLHIFGPGYTLLTNQPGILPTIAELGSVLFEPGSNFSTMEGLKSISVSIGTTNITIKRCELSSIVIATSTNTSRTIINSCYVRNSINALNFSPFDNNNFIITNNYVQNDINFSTNYSGIVKNNIANRIMNLSGWIVENNIIRNNTDFSYLLASNSVEHNLFAGPFTTANGNQENVDMATVFVPTGSFEDQLELAPGSPAIDAAKDGGDCGVFGGPTPYVKGGRPALPTIYAIEHPDIGDDVNGLPVTIRARSQQ